MEFRFVGDPATSALSQTSKSQAPTQSVPKKRVRRWHHRSFTGCLTCRYRHVRCDKASPVCNNCTRLSLECDGIQGRMVFKTYDPSQGHSSPKAHQKRIKTNDLPLNDVAVPAAAAILSPENYLQKDSSGSFINLPITVGHSHAKFRFRGSISPVGLIHTAISSLDDTYYTYFIDQVSTLLIIYDHPTNANPYRFHFPELSHSSPSMVSSMQALGALHRANTSTGLQRNEHLQHAMGKYGDVMQLFRTRYAQAGSQLGITDFATCLLLCFFEVSIYNSRTRHVALTKS